VSHFLEHMMFQGIRAAPGGRRQPRVRRDRRPVQCFTTEENTVYFGAVAPEFQGRLVAILADLLRPALRPEDFDTEKKVILEEIAMYHDQPQQRSTTWRGSVTFGGHPLGNSVLGTERSIGTCPRAAMAGVF